MKTQTPKPTNRLVGNFFHSVTKEGIVSWQGIVIANPEPGWYLVQLFDWIAGEESVRRLMRVEEMSEWLFYGSADEMRHSYEHGTAKLGGPYRKQV